MADQGGLILMVHQGLLDYVKQSLAKGHTFDQIRKALVSTGWPEHHIIEAAHLATRHHRKSKTKPANTSISHDTKLYLIIGLIVLLLGGGASAYLIFGETFSGDPADEYSAEMILEMMEDAHAEVRSYGFSLKTTIQSSPPEGSTEPEEATLLISGRTDTERGNFWQRTDSVAADESQSIISEMYLLDGIIYTYFRITDQWMQSPAPDDMQEQADQISKLLNQNRENLILERLPDEDFNGKGQFVIKSSYEMQASKEEVNDIGDEDTLGEQVVNAPMSIIDEQTMTYFIDRSTLLLTKTLGIITFVPRDENVSHFGSIHLSELLLQDYDEAAPIEIPLEVETARSQEEIMDSIQS